MAPQPVPVSMPARHMDFWDAFQRLAERRIRECNAIAGEDIWQTVSSLDPTPRFVMQSTKNPADFLECSVDLESGILECRPGPAIKANALRFHLPMVEGGPGLTPEEAVTLALDELVCVGD